MADEYVSNLAARFQGIAKAITEDKQAKVYMEIPRESLLKAVGILKAEYDGYHLSTITVLDSGDRFELLYHMPIGPRLLSLRVFLPRSDPTVDSLTGLIPGAILYERELNDIMGIQVRNHPDMRRLLLPDSWQWGHPLRKDWTDPRKKGVK